MSKDDKYSWLDFVVDVLNDDEIDRPLKYKEIWELSPKEYRDKIEAAGKRIDNTPWNSLNAAIGRLEQENAGDDVVYIYPKKNGECYRIVVHGSNPAYYYLENRSDIKKKIEENKDKIKPFKIDSFFPIKEIKETIPEILYNYLFEKMSLTEVEEQYCESSKYDGWFSKAFLNYYGIDTDGDNRGIYNEKDIHNVVEELSKSTELRHRRVAKILREYVGRKDINTSFPRNRIIYGAPGTGKSYKLEREKDVLLGERKDQGCERVTFHPDYSYANFVGTYKPVPVKEDGKKAITYQYVPGPFMRLYVKAVKDPSNPYLLIIEEINRAMVAAVFGDIFQLLDRTKDFESEYPVSASEDIKQYLLENGVPEAECEQLKLPSNLFIWATMNSADQGVFPLDTAFKRRWEFEYLDINSGEDKIKEATVNLKTSGSGEIEIEWNELRKAINNLLIGYGINEDKLLGPFFISPNTIKNESGEIDPEKFKTVFKNKVLMYLYDDAAKQVRAKLFGGCWTEAKTFSAICKKFDECGIDIFPQSLKNEVTQNQNE